MSPDAHGSAIQMWTKLSAHQAQPDLLSREEAHFWLLPLAQPTAMLEELGSTLTSDEHERAARFHFERDSRRFIAARGLLRRLLGQYAGAPAGAIRFDAGLYGKPHLAPMAAPAKLEFSLSHSGEWGLVGISRDTELGVDLEQVRPMSDYHDLAKGNFAAAEVTALEQLPEHQQLDGFFACWTRKEAYVKALGLGLSLDLASFVVSVEPERKVDIVASKDTGAEHRVSSMQPLDGFWAATAVKMSPSPGNLTADRVSRYFILAA